VDGGQVEGERRIVRSWRLWAEALVHEAVRLDTGFAYVNRGFQPLPSLKTAQLMHNPG